MDSSFDIVEKLYLRTRGKPLEAVKEGMEILGRSFEDKDIGGAGLTGSGRALGAALVGADVVKNEITAHARAAAFIDPEIHTVIEIGGQDSKLIVMKDGFVEDFAMNTVCAAGTGSFLDRQAERMGISVDEMGRMAAEAGKSVSYTHLELTTREIRHQLCLKYWTLNRTRTLQITILKFLSTFPR